MLCNQGNTRLILSHVKVLTKEISFVIPRKTENIYIAYSGGIDSHVLLHFYCSIAECKSKITAIYIHHGLQLDADQWAEHCKGIASGLGVKFQCIKVSIKKTSGQSLEEAARDVRYHALKKVIHKHDVLLVAQHREDQMETVLLQLFRGAGIQGLSAMPLTNAFGTGLIARPLLDTSKQKIIDYAINNQLQWIEDSSNKSNEFDRNYLRNQIVPKLKQRWPALDKTISRSARHCANSHVLIVDLSDELLAQMFDHSDHTLNIPQLLELDTNRQYLVIRRWFNHFQLRMPSENNLWRIVNEVAMVKKSANAEVRSKNYSIKRYRDKLFCLKPAEINRQNCEKNWINVLTPLDLDDGRKLNLTPASAGIPKQLWQKSTVSVRFRQGAEKIRLEGREGHHSLKKLFQEKAIPPWQRSQIPLIYLDGKLAAIADLWISVDFVNVSDTACYQLTIQQNDLGDA